jgi:hypothetical protein
MAAIGMAAVGVQSSEVALGAMLNLDRWCIAAAAARIDDECGSLSLTNSGLRSGDLDHEEGAMRWCIPLVWTCR